MTDTVNKYWFFRWLPIDTRRPHCRTCQYHHVPRHQNPLCAPGNRQPTPGATHKMVQVRRHWEGATFRSPSSVLVAKTLMAALDGAAITQQHTGNLQVGQASQQRAGGLASPEAVSAPGTNVNTMLLLQLVSQICSLCKAPWCHTRLWSIG